MLKKRAQKVGAGAPASSHDDPYRTRYNQPDPELTKSREYSGSINYFSKEFRELPGLDTTIIVPNSIKNTPILIKTPHYCFALFFSS